MRAASTESLTVEQAKRLYADLFAVEASHLVVRQLPPEHSLSVLTGDHIEGVSPLPERSVTLSDITKVAIRFFYVDGITPQGSFRAHICVG